MKHLLIIAAVVLSSCLHVSAQAIANGALQERINSLGAQKSIALTFDPDGKTTKVMAVSENFSRAEASEAGVQAMNFAVGFLYAGESLRRSPESYILTFWVLSIKPRFSANHSMTVVLPDEMLVIGSARYVGKPREQMEYLNFEISRENLARIAAQSNVRFHLGDEVFTFTNGHMKLLADLLAVTEVQTAKVQ